MRDYLNCFILIILFLLLPNKVWSHGGEDHEDQKPKSPEIGSEHVIEPLISMEEDLFETSDASDASSSSGEGTYGIETMDGSMELKLPRDPLSGSGDTSLFENTDPLGLGVQPEQKSESRIDHSGHDMGKMKKVNLAEHEWNSTSQKGYGFAFSFTLIILFFFLLLMLKRPFE